MKRIDYIREIREGMLALLLLFFEAVKQWFSLEYEVDLNALDELD